MDIAKQGNATVHNFLYASLGATIRSKRDSAGMSQDVLASKVGLSRTSVTNIERGRQSVLVHQLYLFAEALGVEPAALLPDAPKRERLRAEPVSAEVAEMVSRLRRTR